jgi:hypothetical protein
MTVKSPKNASASPAAETLASPEQPNPKLILPLGRGHNGKSFWTQWMIDRAQTQGREVVVADGDRTNPSLAAYFEGVLTPPSAEPDDMEDWFSAICEQQAERRFNTVIDLGGGDQLLKSLARRIDFSEFSKYFGVDLVAVHLLTPDIDDLAFLRDLEADGLFAPEATIVVLNEGRTDGRRSFDSAFKAVLDHPVFLATVKRGAKPIAMPRLSCASELALRRLTMSTAESGRSKDALPPLGPLKRQTIARWLRDMERSFAPVAAWLA